MTRAPLSLSSVALLALPAAWAGTPCEYTLEDSIAITISHSVDLLLSVSTTTPPTHSLNQSLLVLHC
jgi:hypothetical protein